MRQCLLRLAAAVTVGFLAADAYAAEQFTDLLRRVPGDANAVVLINVKGLHESPLGQKENWAQKHQQLYLEGGIRIPTIIRWPGVAASGSTCAAPIISNDYFPTLLEAAAIKRQANHTLDGVSLVTLLRGESIEPRTLYWDYPHYGNQGGSPGSAIRDGYWKLIEWREDDTVELYDLGADSGERNDVSRQNPDVVKRLRDALVSWRHEVGAKSTTPNPRFQETDK